MNFDFDGDGMADQVMAGRRFNPGARPDPATGRFLDHGTVQVRSGRDGRVLFENRDPLEYESDARAFPLGDLDGDGCAELALVHPRMDRSRYDLELVDRLFGAKSWVTIVSGAQATR